MQLLHMGEVCSNELPRIAFTRTIAVDTSVGNSSYPAAMVMELNILSRRNGHLATSLSIVAHCSANIS
jgi:hypothetical protein